MGRSTPDPEDLFLAELLKKSIKYLPILLILNKADQVDPERKQSLKRNTRRWCQRVNLIWVSAIEGEGVAELMEGIIEESASTPTILPARSGHRSV